MTRQNAAERVAIYPWAISCATCQGRGWHERADTTFPARACKDCDARGYQRTRLTFAELCALSLRGTLTTGEAKYLADLDAEATAP